jgi:hypothetical protein
MMHVSILKIIMKNVCCALNISIKLESFVWGKFVISSNLFHEFSQNASLSGFIEFVMKDAIQITNLL